MDGLCGSRVGVLSCPLINRAPTVDGHCMRHRRLCGGKSREAQADSGLIFEERKETESERGRQGNREEERGTEGEDNKS